VTGGTFFQTYDTCCPVTLSPDGGPSGLADPATVSGFRLDKYLVTVGRFRQFVAAWSSGSGFTPPSGSGKHTYLNNGQGLVTLTDAGTVYETGWVSGDDRQIGPTDANLGGCDPGTPTSTWTPSASANENLPINCVNWYEAYAFCIWDGGFLPTVVEWTYAAAGGSLQREYPWGDTDPGTQNQYAIYSDGVTNLCYYPRAGTCVGLANIAPVGTAGQGQALWGQLDLVGDVQEWTLDSGSLGRPKNAACTDCVYLASPTDRSTPGGAFLLGPDLLSPSYDVGDPGMGATSRYGRIGFRCARAP
jgi:formylglycine-generating enzyme required for sulfatase activity